MPRKRTLIILTAIMAILSLLAAASARTASEKVLYSFNPQAPDGFHPRSNLISDSSGNLYGTTTAGGVHSAGSVFELSPNGKGGWTEKVLYSFNDNGSDGVSPYAGVVFDGKGNLYGTTYQGGAYAQGTAFELAPNGSGGWTETVLHSFNSTTGDGEYPYAGLVIDGKGNLYGTTIFGGGGLGAAFELSPNGSGGWTEKVIYSFAANVPDGYLPYASMILDGKGNLYGTTYYSYDDQGNDDNGAVFELSPNGSGGWTETLLYNFTSNNPTDAAFPYQGSLIFDAKGNLYGMTNGGGNAGLGAVFELSHNGGGWTEAVIYSFANNRTDGRDPYAGLISDSAGNLYGTTFDGGTHGFGTVFELTPAGGGIWTEKVLHNFNRSKTDGQTPYSSLLLDAKGNLYGTTMYAGAYFTGTVFELSPTAAGAWKEKVLHSFNPSGGDGQNPTGPVTFDAKGNLYGTTSTSGTDGFGTVFELSPGSGSWTEKTLLNFNNTDGAGPLGGLVFDSAGNIYGTTNSGGTHFGYGNVFELSPGSGTWTETVLQDFATGKGGNAPAYESMIFDAKGNLYGTTPFGGTHAGGTAFELSPNGSGGWTETVLYNFCAKKYCTDGSNPNGSLIFDGKGNLYGMTNYGAYGVGMVFELSPNGSGGWTETVLYNFAIFDNTGDPLFSSLTFDNKGNLYGTTNYGGSGLGSVFELSPESGGWAEFDLHDFAGGTRDGYFPLAGVIFDAAYQNLYGTTESGGAYGMGTVFELSLGSGTETVLYSFKNDGTDGQKPYGGLVSDSKGNLYGTTEKGGTNDAGTVFEITP